MGNGEPGEEEPANSDLEPNEPRKGKQKHVNANEKGIFAKDSKDYLESTLLFGIYSTLWGGPILFGNPKKYSIFQRIPEKYSVIFWSIFCPA